MGMGTGTVWLAARGTTIATNRLVFRLLLRLIRQLIPTKIAVLHSKNCSGTAVVVAKRLSGMVYHRNRYRRPQTNSRPHRAAFFIARCLSQM